MTVSTTCAKPYARAIFDLALKDDQLSLWDRVLRLLAEIASEYDETGILRNPKVVTSQKILFFNDAVEKFPQAMNLLKLLAERKKLSLLPEIAFDYQELFFAYNKTLEVKVVSAIELTRLQKQQLSQKIQKIHGGEVLLQYYVDDKLIGGVVVYLKDRVIDSSIKGMLQRLRENLLTKSVHA